MSLPRTSLQTLDAFERVARSGSMQTAASEMGISVSSVSHHIARLEEELRASLFDRSSRPFDLTREGQQALQHLSKGLFHIRRATNETAFSGLLGIHSLRIGIVEEFESGITPELAAFLAKQMPRTTLSIATVLSHEASSLLQKGKIDLAIVSETEGYESSLISEPIMRDPLVAAVPQTSNLDPSNLFADHNNLAFLRFNQSHAIGKQIEAHLKRNSIDLPVRFVFDSAQSIMAIIAGGTGWSVITPLGYMRAQRFSASVRLHSLPLPSLARKITLLSRDSFDEPLRQALATLLHQMINREIVEPVYENYPWLIDSMTVGP